MSWVYTPYVLALLTAGAISAVLALHAWIHRRAALGAPTFALLMAAGAAWTLGDAFQVVSTAFETKLLWAKLQYPGIVLVPVAWLAFAIQYTGRAHWLRPPVVGLLAVVPLVTLLVVAANPADGGLFWSRLRLVPGDPFPVLEGTRGPWFWVNTGYAYLCLATGTALLLPHALAGFREALYRRQVLAMLLGVTIPWLANAAFVFRREPLRQDPTPFAIAVSGLAFAWALFRLHLLDLGPVAREAVIEGMDDGLIIVDARDRVVDLNPSARRILRLGGAQVVGRPAAEVLGGWEALCGGSQELSLGEGDGLRDYDVRVSPLRDRLGRVTGRLIVCHDVSGRKRVEAQLRAQKQLFENLLALARATTERPSLQATLQNALEVASSLTGAENASLFLLDEAGTVTHSLVSDAGIVHRPEDIGPVMSRGLAGWVARHRQAALLHDAAADPRWLTLPGEDPRVRSALCVPIWSGATLAGVLTLVHPQPGAFGPEHRDLIQAAADQMALAVRNAQIFDARTRMAERQTTLFEVLRAVSGALDPREAARVAVEVIAQHTGWPNVMMALPSPDGVHWSFEYASPETPALQLQPLGAGVIGRAYRAGRTQVVPDVRADPDYVESLPAVRSELAVPIRHRGRSLGVLNLERDVPSAFDRDDIQLAESLAGAVGLALESARLYHALAFEHERLLALERTRDDLTHTLVHDLRNPLTTVSGVLDSLAESPAGLSPQQKELVGVGRSSARRMGGLVEAILDVSRLESGRMPLAPAPVALAPLVRETLALQAPLADEKGVRLYSHVPEEHPPAWADPALVGRVLQNLVGNAVKFTPAGGSVRVKTHVDPAEPAVLKVAVSDTGPGIPASLRDRLFQKFAAAGPGQGSGLGLAFCRLAVEAQGGRIAVESAPGEGAIFSFTLPLARTDAETK